MLALILNAIAGFMHEALGIKNLKRFFIVWLVASIVPVIIGGIFSPILVALGIEVLALTWREAIVQSLALGLFGFVVGFGARYIIEWLVVRV